MSKPEIQALVVDIVQAALRLRTVKDKQIKEFLETVVNLELEELNELEALNGGYWGSRAI